MYTLTLTVPERQAIDWIGYRYAHGDDLAEQLMRCERTEDDWTHEDSITFYIPEHIAWEIRELCEEDNLACLSPEFASKLIEFCDSIV